MRRTLIVLACCAASLVSACTRPSKEIQSPFLLTPSAGISTPAPPPSITLAFGGDVHFAERTLALLDDPATAFGPVSSVLSAADIAMVNLETAVTTGGTPEPKQFHFRAPPSAFAAIRAAGVDVVTLANNHSLDFGQVGLADTLAAASVPVVGAGADAAAAYAPWITTVKGVRLAFLGFSQITELASTWAATDSRPGIAMALDFARALAAIRSARSVADVVVVYMHWGQEYNECPIALQTSFAQAAAEAGASVIVGTHAHVMQGSGWLGSSYVFYGLSNFLWWWNDAQSNDTGVLQVTLTGSSITGTSFVPAYIDRTTGQPIPSTGAEAARISSAQEALQGCTGLAPR
jgi:poly-gamma-glutamate synthesis protein (capsule biosynthesis protein)